MTNRKLTVAALLTLDGVHDNRARSPGQLRRRGRHARHGRPRPDLDPGDAMLMGRAAPTTTSAPARLGPLRPARSS